MRYAIATTALVLVTFTSLSQQTAGVKPTQKTAKTEKKARPDDPYTVFSHPPESAKPGVLWMWMGSNLSKQGITRDLEALKAEGFNRTTMFSLADVTTPWAGEIGKSPTPDIISWTKPWWELVRYAAQESKRLHMDFGMFNGPSYESSGGPWITPELSMQEICWSATHVTGGSHISTTLDRPQVDPRANQPFPVYNPETGLVEKPVIPARKTYYKDIAVLALPAQGIVPKDSVIDLTDKMLSDGQLDWDAPNGDWIIYRFGHTTMGALIQPAQWKATGLECDKMSQTAVDFHIDHVIGEIQRYLGDLVGDGFTHVHFDSYEAGYPTWTPQMKIEFANRRGYDITPWLATFAGRAIGSSLDSLKFQRDFDATVKDLYRDVYFSTLARKLKAAHLTFLCEPYGGPWRQEEIMPLVQNVMAEFWTNHGVFSPYELYPTIAALRKSGQNLVEAEAFTGDPADSKWDETPAWLKPIGDAAFCAGVNRFVLHRFVEQPWDDRYRPGATMGRWGTHFDRTQTWWKPGRAMVTYWQRCQALLQWGRIVLNKANDFTATVTRGQLSIKSIHRSQDSTDIYFVANLSRDSGAVLCTFAASGMQPELWDPVTGFTRLLHQYTDSNGVISLELPFAEAQSFFIVFRRKIHKMGGGKPSDMYPKAKADFPMLQTIKAINGPWQVRFDSAWGGPAGSVIFDTLQDWTSRPEKGIRYFSGTAVYHTSFNLSPTHLSGKHEGMTLDLGVVKHVAHVRLNNKDLGIIWTAPWSVRIPAGLLQAKNQLTIEITNVWANRLIGDEQEPEDCLWLPGHIAGGNFLKEFPDWFLNKQPRPSKGRFCFTTWNYFTKDSPLIPSGLIGPVTIIGPDKAGSSHAHSGDDHPTWGKWKHWGAQKNGTYANPVLPADYSDIDCIRVGDAYYAISSTFQYSPGMIILRSADLVNWTIIGHVAGDLRQISPDMNWDRMNRYGRGVWAGAIRYYDHKFWVYFGTPDEGYFMSTAVDPAGPWEPLHQVLNSQGWDDCCPFWDDDGEVYLLGTDFKDGYQIHLFKLTMDGRDIVPGWDKVIHRSAGSEANKFYKINGWYYHLFSEVKPEGRVLIMERARNVEGPYLEVRQLNHAEKKYNEPNQGGLIQTQKGDWYFLTHHGTGDWAGRIVSLLPVTWISDWPVIGKVGPDSIGLMTWTGSLPIKDQSIIHPQTSDDFMDEDLSPQWEWNYQPRKEKWSLKERSGWLRLYACRPLKSGGILTAANTLTQRAFRTGYNKVTMKIDAGGMTDGQRAGLAHFGSPDYAAFGIVCKGQIKNFELNIKGAVETGPGLQNRILWLRSIWGLDGQSRFYYSLDGLSFYPFGQPYRLKWGSYRGDRIAIYSYNDKGETGFIDVDFLHYSFHAFQ